MVTDADYSACVEPSAPQGFVLLNIGERLKVERVRLGFNQADFAALAGVAKTSQFNYEKGERSPDAAYLAAITGVGVDVLYVVTGERKPVASNSIPSDEAQLLEHYRSLPAAVKASLAQLANTLANPASS